MKKGTPRHPKMYKLAEALNVPLYAAVGIMQMLWEHAGAHTPQGDIGSLPDAAIAQSVQWTKKTGILVQGLVDSKWVDEVPEHRLVIHDWPDHCERSVKQFLDYHGKDFLPYYRNLSAKLPRINENLSLSCEEKEKVEEKVKAEGGLGETSWFPVEFIENDFGRRDPNPEWLLAQEALRKARLKIANAYDPVAYERRVVETAIAKARKAQC